MSRTARYAVVPALAAAVLAVPLSADAAAPVARPTFAANAYGSTVMLGSTLSSGETAHVPLCTRKLGAMNSDQTAALDITGVGHLGAVTTHVGSDAANGSPESTADTQTGASSLFAGELSFGAVTTNASATRTGSTTTLAGSSVFTDLTIAGQEVPAAPPANSVYALPGVGTARLNVQKQNGRFGNPTIFVSAVIVTVSATNTLGLPSGTIVIGRSSASLHNPTQRAVTGTAYGSTVVLGSGVVKSGRTAPVYLPCGGTAGQTATSNATARTVLPSVLDSGVVASKAYSTENATRTAVTTSNRIADASLLGGVVDAKNLFTRAFASRSGSTLSRNSTGTSIGTLTVNGTVQPVTDAANQSYPVPNVGTLYVHTVTQTANGLSVIGLRLVLSQAQGGLPAGTVITIGAASAGVLPQ